MHLFSDDRYLQLLENGKLGNQELDHYPVVKLFMPGTNNVWIISHMYNAERNIAWGLYYIYGSIPIQGFIDLNDLASIKHRSSYSVLSDENFEAKYPMSAYVTAAKICERITEKDALLKKCYAAYLVKNQ